jgi:hypothetical protein
VPAASKILKGVIPERLKSLATARTDQRSVRWHRKQDQFALAYEFRSRLEADNAEDEGLRLKVLEIFEGRIRDNAPGLSPELTARAARISLRTVQKTFEEESLQFAAFLSGKLPGSMLPTIAETVDNLLSEEKLQIEERSQLRVSIVSNLQSAFYKSHESERLLFARLSATFTLLFCLNTEPRVVEYFHKMTADFSLYVGSDLIVQALVERYL